MKPLWFKAAAATNPGLLVRLGALGVVMLSVAGAFACTGGWLSPAALTQDRMMATFRDANSQTPPSTASTPSASSTQPAPLCRSVGP